MDTPKPSLIDRILTLPQYLIPQHLLSRLILKLTRLQMGAFTHWLIRRFIKHYDVDMSQVQSSDVRDYASFNQFFTRALKPTARPLADVEIISPVDAKISQIGKIDENRLLQAKGRFFRLEDLLGGNQKMVNLFKSGLFGTLYLSPKDYHRIHMPITGQLTDMMYIPGRLFSVNQRTSEVVPNLFARNERVICLFETALGPMALILVGALFVGSIETVWMGTVTPNRWSQIQHWHYDEVQVIQRGDEMGRFNMGSTVIVLLDANRIAWLSKLSTQTKVLMGQGLAKSLTINH
ncbi:MAG: phosphatidylserine decarboxylase [Gammaproteobacteria bacterium]|nr:MAG: phosphatidylserine decarboxylase [Gammaproteobacteria bacterium]RKZ41390.1 MAG: phosphatidylserine decarboxylase [Gammaproteobacteria bacterium]RKZ75318.1 MAG: phosphatidylserine decarboxylase [Gammaproteobacteria bacterium]